MSKDQSDISEERKKEVVDRFVSMYVEKGGEYPTLRDVKNDKFISEQEFVAVRKLGLLDDWQVRWLAKAKTGIDYPPISKRHQERNMEVKRNQAAANLKSLKQVLHDFATEKLRWPTDVEIRVYRRNNIPGWRYPDQIYRYLGGRRKWAEQIFPEGLPDGFVATTARGNRQKSANLLK